MAVLATFLFLAAALLLEPKKRPQFLTCSDTALNDALCGVGLSLTISGTALWGCTRAFRKKKKGLRQNRS